MVLLSTVVMSWMLDLFLSFFTEFWRRKYFWAWLATWVGVLVTTTFLEMLLQSPLPNFFNPTKNNLPQSASWSITRTERSSKVVNNNFLTKIQ
uniref:Uncharacterized protein n=1 Tax=Rhizophora mucronata TaxID=61149 RepID=A0A2P2PY86_RHIMU